MKAAKFSLRFVRNKQLTPQIYSFHFYPTTSFTFLPGQYIQLNLPHKADEKGTTRYFSIASSPTEKEIMIVTKLSLAPSDKRGITSFKQQMLSLQPGDTIDAFGPIGKFTLED